MPGGASGTTHSWFPARGRSVNTSTNRKGISMGPVWRRPLLELVAQLAGVAQWQSSSLPSWLRGFDSRHPLEATCAGSSGDRAAAF